MKDKMFINPTILRWAKDTKGYSTEECYLHFGEDKFSSWINGLDYPTYQELKKIGKFFKKPIALFFFPEPPDIKNIESSFRTLSNSSSIFTPDVISLLDWGRIMQLNLYELHDGVNPSSHIITKQSFDLSKIEITASKLRGFFSEIYNVPKNFNSYEKAFNYWREIFFHAGVYVFKNAFKNDNISGFCIYDSTFSVICINNQLAIARQIFTLFHEIYHILYKTSGVDLLNDSEINEISSNEIERKCNEFAGVFLVPDKDFLEFINGKIIDDELVQKLAKMYFVSREVILRKLLKNKCITIDTYRSKYKKIYGDNFRKKSSDKNTQDNNKNGGNYYNTQIAYKGRHYIELAYSSFYSHKITLPQLAKYMDMRISSVKQLALNLDWGTI
jgi:Zn-dependent peptidase ImmA (M78 family)